MAVLRTADYEYSAQTRHLHHSLARVRKRGRKG